MNARRITILAALTFAGIVFGATSPASATADRPGLTATSAQASYRSGDLANLSFTVTNGTSSACQLSDSPSGTFVIQSVTRDGQPVASTKLCRSPSAAP